jgi:hypothetical protein
MSQKVDRLLRAANRSGYQLCYRERRGDLQSVSYSARTIAEANQNQRSNFPVPFFFSLPSDPRLPNGPRHISHPRKFFSNKMIRPCATLYVVARRNITRQLFFLLFTTHRKSPLILLHKRVDPLVHPIKRLLLPSNLNVLPAQLHLRGKLLTEEGIQFLAFSH